MAELFPQSRNGPLPSEYMGSLLRVDLTSGTIPTESMLLEPIPDGKHRGFTIAKWLPDLIWEYYRLSGRHEKSGRPFMNTLVRLGLEEFQEWSQLD